MATPAPSPSPGRSEPTRARRWRRRIRRGVIAAGLFLVVLALLLTQTSLVGWLVLPRVESILGCRATARRISLTPRGQLTAEGLTLRVPGFDGPAGVFLDVPELECSIDWWSLLSGAPRPTHLTLRRPLLRLSQDGQLALNVATLGSGAPGAGAAAAQVGLVPSVDVIDGTAEFGEHGPGWYTPLTSIRVHGRLARVDQTSSRYTVELVEIPTASAPGAPAAPTPLSLLGDFDLQSISGTIRLSNVDLARFKDTALPSRVHDLWRRMAIRGQINQTAFSYDRSAGVSATFQLVDVDLNIPLPAERGDEPESAPAQAVNAAAGALPRPTELLQMRQVTGEIRFDASGLRTSLRGRIEDLECRVSLSTRGFTLDSPLECRISADRFKVAEQPRLLPFAPWYVKRNFQRFSGPTAVVDGLVEIRRGPPTPEGPAPLSVQGSLRFRNGTAEFEKFRYPFADMTGTVNFNDSGVDLVDITGRGPTGATLLATGRIEPPNENAGVRVDVTAVNVPTDDVLREAIPPHRRRILDALFSASAYDRLRSEGLAQSTAQFGERRARRDEIAALLRRPEADRHGPERAALEQELAGLDTQLGVPVFDLGGTCAISVSVTREAGPHVTYMTDIDVRLPKAGLIPEAFPYPAVAEGLRIHITDDAAEAEAESLHALTGGRGAMSVRVRLGESGGSDAYDITAKAAAIPIDRYLLAALPGRGAEAPGGPEGAPGPEDRWSARRLVRELGVQGSAACEVHVFSREAADTGFEVDVTFDDLAARPGDADLRLSNLSGHLLVTREGVELKALEGRIGEGHLAATASVDGLRPETGTPLSLDASASVSDFDLALPVERLVASFSLAEAETLSRLRAEHRPAGLVDAALSLSVRGEAIDYQLDLDRPRGVALGVLEGRLSVVDSGGGASISPAEVACRGFSADLEFEGQGAGRLSLDGVWPLKPGGPASLEVDLQRARFEAPVSRALARRLEPGIADWMILHDLSGGFSARGRAEAEPGDRPVFHGSLEPTSLAFTSGGRHLLVDDITGRLTFSRDGGRLENVSARTERWSCTATGSWAVAPEPALDLSFELVAQGLPDDLHAVLPPGVSDALNSADLRLDGALRISDARLVYAPEAEGRGEPALRFSAEAGFERARFSAVVPVEEADGTASIRAESGATPAAPSKVEVAIRADHLTSASVSMTDAEVRLVSGDRPGVFVFPLIRAKAHGGELTARAAIWSAPTVNPGGDNPGAGAGARGASGTDYEAKIQLSGVDFAMLLDDLREAPAEGSPAPEPARPGSRGELDAELSVAGTIGREPTRRGRGLLRVQGGEVVSLPGVVGLLRLSNLQPPIGERLEYASAGFFLRGDLLTFEHLEASSESVTIAGDGTMRWPSTEIDLRFNSHGRSHIPVLSTLFEGLRNELITTVVTGTLREPAYEIEQLPATKRMLGTIFRGEPRRHATASASPSDAGDKDHP